MTVTSLHQTYNNGYRVPYIYCEQVKNNADVVSKLVERHGHRYAPVCKGVFQRAGFFDCLRETSPSCIYVSDAHQDLPRDRKIISLYPSAAINCLDWPIRVGRTELDLEILSSVINARDPRNALKLMIPVLTSEGREGLLPSEISDFCKVVSGRFGNRVSIEGFIANYGCVNEAAPPVEELSRLMGHCASILNSLTGSNPIFSLGGSAVLPIIENIPKTLKLDIEVRIGEAILSGTIPGHAPLKGLNPTGVLYANVTQRRVEGHDEVVIVDQGSRRLAPTKRRTISGGFKIRQMSSEHCVLERPISTSRDLTCGVEFEMTYSDMAKNENFVFVNTKNGSVHSKRKSDPLHGLGGHLESLCREQFSTF